MLNLDDILYYFITTIITSHLSSTNAFQKPPDAHIRAFILLGKQSINRRNMPFIRLLLPILFWIFRPSN